MKKNSFKNLACLGIASGLCVVQSMDAAVVDAKAKATDPKAKEAYDPNSQNLGYHLYTEEELLTELNDEGSKLYMSLTPEGKQVAREIASQLCNGTNGCKGRGACKTEKHDCAGKNACKGESKCAVSDKNLAVQLASKIMAEKRADALKK
jgi:hypothetical protein